MNSSRRCRARRDPADETVAFDDVPVPEGAGLRGARATRVSSWLNASGTIGQPIAPPSSLPLRPNPTGQRRHR